MRQACHERRLRRQPHPARPDESISALNGRKLETVFGPPREGDIKHSLAEISLATAKIGYRPKVTFSEGLRRVFATTGPIKLARVITQG